MNEPPKKRRGCLKWGAITVLVLWLIAILIPAVKGTAKSNGQGKAVANCKQIMLALEQWSHDNGLAYPDGWAGSDNLKSSNQVFRKLFTDGIIMDERVFTCPTSMFTLDNDLGYPPTYDKALAPGECHWMLLKRQTGMALGKTPLIIENSLNTSWPPKWDVSPPKQLRKRAQAWRGRQIIIGRNDGSVQVERLRPDGTLDWHSAPNLDASGKSWIDYLTPEQLTKLEYWDIEEK